MDENFSNLFRTATDFIPKNSKNLSNFDYNYCYLSEDLVTRLLPFSLLTKCVAVTKERAAEFQMGTPRLYTFQIRMWSKQISLEINIF